VHGGASQIDCFAKWGGAIGRITAYSGHGRGYRPCSDHTLGLFELKCLPVVAERMWLRRRPFLEGAKGQVRVNASRKGGLGKKRRDGCDTVLAIGKTEGGEGGEGQTTECVEMWVHALNSSKEMKLTENENRLLAEKKGIKEINQVARRG